MWQLGTEALLDKESFDITTCLVAKLKESAVFKINIIINVCTSLGHNKNLRYIIDVFSRNRKI